MAPQTEAAEGGREQKYDGKFRVVFDAIRKLMQTDKPKPTLGFGREKMG